MRTKVRVRMVVVALSVQQTATAASPCPGAVDGPCTSAGTGVGAVDAPTSYTSTRGDCAGALRVQFSGSRVR